MSDGAGLTLVHPRAVAEVLTWNRILSVDEMKEVSQYLGGVLGARVCCEGVYAFL